MGKEYYVNVNAISMEGLSRLLSEKQTGKSNPEFEIKPVTIKMAKEFKIANEFADVGFKIDQGEEFISIQCDDIHDAIGDFVKNDYIGMAAVNVSSLQDSGVQLEKYTEETKYANIDSLLSALQRKENSRNIESLLEVLTEQGKEQEKQQIELLVKQMNEMEKGYNTLFNDLTKELIETREQLNSLQSTQISGENRSEIVGQLETFKNSLQDQNRRLRTLRQNLDQKAGKVLQSFKKIGLSSLNNVCTFLGIKENLTVLRDISRSNAMEMRNAIEKIDRIGNEVKNAVTHTKNIVRAIAGKEMLDPSAEKQFKFFEKLKAPYQKRLEVFSERTEKLNKAIEKFDRLEYAAGRSSVRKKLAENKEKLTSKEKEESGLQKEKEKTYEPSL